MDQIATEINKLNLRIDDIEVLLKKPLTEEEKEEFGSKEQLREERKQLRKKEEQLRELLILQLKGIKKLTAGVTVTLPKLGDANSMYDIFGRISSKPTSTPSRYTSPSFHKTNHICAFTEQEDIVPPLSQQEREAILNETNKLWEFGINEIIQPSVSIGSTENVVDDYVRCVVKSVSKALKLNVRLEQQSFINSKRADHWVIAFGQNEKQGWIVGCNENKLPHTKYQEPYVTNKNEFLVQIYDQMTEVFNYSGTIPVFGIGSTGREWRFFKLPRDDSCKLGDASVLSLHKVESKEQDDYSPLTGNMGPIQYDSDDEMEIEQEDGEIQEEKEMRLTGTEVYKWNDQEMLFTLGSVLKQMSLSKMTQISIVTEDSIKGRVMWHLVKTDTVSPWGWAKLSVSKLHWRSMINTSTNNVVILGMLGKGADGKVVLVSNNKGQVSAMKLLRTEENAREEAQNWTEIYWDYCQQYSWSIRSEKWMGIPAVIMPVLNQFMTKKERLDSLDGVKECLQLFWTRGYLHDDIYWRNIGYFKAKGKIVIILLDLHPTRCFKQENDGAWIEQAIEKLKKRAEILPES
jgi:hypothetical protein